MRYTGTTDDSGFIWMVLIIAIVTVVILAGISIGVQVEDERNDPSNVQYEITLLDGTVYECTSYKEVGGSGVAPGTDYKLWIAEDDHVHTLTIPKSTIAGIKKVNS